MSSNVNDSYYQWFASNVFQQQALELIPNANETGTVRELAVMAKREDLTPELVKRLKPDETKMVARNAVFYDIKTIWDFMKGRRKASVLTTIDYFKYTFPNGRLYPYNWFNRLAGNKAFDPDLNIEVGYRALLAGCDLLFDFDACNTTNLDNNNLLLQFWCKLEKDFGKENVYVKHSGKKGVHILIPQSVFKLENNLVSSPELCKVIAESYTEFGLETIGLDYNIYKQRQIFRIPLSPHEISDCISIPLVKSDLTQKFDVKDYHIDKCLKILKTEPEFFEKRAWKVKQSVLNANALKKVLREGGCNVF